MTSIDLDLIALLYGLYAHECIHWLKEEDIAYTRSYSSTWKEWRHTELSFTLLHRLPCAANLFPFASGFISFQQGSFSEDRVLAILRKVDRLSIRSHRSIRLASSVQGTIMLILVPLVIGTKMLSYAWLPLLAVALVSHTITACLFVRNIRLWEKQRQKIFTDALSVWLNPLAAIRSGDVLLQRMFQVLATQSGQINSCEEPELDVSF